MNYKEGYWNTFNETSIWVREWIPDNPPDLIILMIHGLGEHSGRYEQWAERFVEEGIAFIAPDLRGHGKSPGSRGHVSSFSFFLKDISYISQNIRNKFQDIPIIIYGHSLGANIALNYVIKNNCEFEGTIASSPWLKLTNALSGLEVMLARICSKIIPRCRIGNRIKPSYLTRDATILNDIKENNLIYPKISFKLLYQAYISGIFASTSIYKINCPMLLMHGEADKVTSFKASNDFVQNAGNFTRFVTFKDGHHELHNDIIKDDVFKTVIQWIKENFTIKAESSK